MKEKINLSAYFSVEEGKEFQKKMIERNEDFINNPQGFPQDVENCGENLKKSSEKPGISVIKGCQILKHNETPPFYKK
ncbi:MAG: hypothetical protein IKC26_11030 [Clostridia bacterium]|nr:hypothetical protein [Clostridia bacterium]MBR2908559.1 hypothetical protein [Clostridia bacterium]